MLTKMRSFTCTHFYTVSLLVYYFLLITSLTSILVPIKYSLSAAEHQRTEAAFAVMYDYH